MPIETYVTYKEKTQQQRLFFNSMKMFYDQTTEIDATTARNISNWLLQLKNALYATEPGDFDYYDHEFSQKTLDAHNNLKKYVEDTLKAKVKTYHTKDLEKLSDILNSKIYNQIIETCKTRVEFGEKCVGDEKPINKEITDYISKFDINGTKPTISECLNMDIAKEDPDKIMGHLLWLSRNELMANRLFKEKYNGIYKETCDKLIDQLERAEPDVAMKYALKIFSLETSLKDLCFKRLNEYKAEAPQNTDADTYACIRLSESDEYHALQGIHDAKSRLFYALTSKAISTLAEDTFIKANNDFDKRDSHIIGDLLSGQMASILKENNVIQNDQVVTAKEFDQSTKALEKSGYITKPELQSLIDDYKLMINDREKKSTTYQNMEDSLKAFLDLDHITITDKADYNKKLDDVIKFTDAYYKKNAGYKVTKNGEKRRDYSHALLEHLNSYKLALVPKELDDSYFHTEGYSDSNIAQKASKEALEKNISKEKYLEIMLSKDSPADKNLDKIINDAKKIDPTIPELDLSLSDNEIQERKAIQDIAKKNFYSSQYDILSIDEQIKLGNKMGYYKDKEAKEIINNRDIAKFFLKYGNDTKTKLENIDIIQKIQIDDIDKKSKNRFDEYHKNVASLLTKRITELEQVDYDKYYRMSDKELAENYPKFQQDCLACTLISHVVSTFKDNPLITQELKDRAKVIENKYSNLVTTTNERIQLITNPYYIKYKNPALDLSVPQAMNLQVAFMGAGDRDIETYLTKASGQKQFGNTAFVDQMKSQVCTNIADEQSFNNVSFYDLNGKQLDERNIAFIASKGPVIAINNDNPAKYAFFTANKNNALATKAEETIELKQSLKNIAERKIVEANIKEYKDSLKDKNFNISATAYSSKAGALIKPLSMLNLTKVATTINKEPLNDQQIERIKLASSSVRVGISKEQFNLLFDKEPFASHKEELYTAACLDIKYQNLLKEEAKNILDSYDINKFSLNELKQFAKDNNIPSYNSEQKEKIKALGKKVLEEQKKKLITSTFSPTAKDRAYGILMHKPGLTEAEQKDISLKSHGNDHNLLLNDIADTMLLLDIDTMSKSSMSEFMDNFAENEYLQNLAFDYSYMNKAEMKDIIPESEQAEYIKFCEASYGMLNYQMLAACLMATNVGPEFDISKIDINQAAEGQANNKVSANNQFFADILTMNVSLPTPEVIKKGKDAYANILENRWVNTLLGKPKISKEEVEFINDCITGPDKAHGRMRLYEYAMNEVQEATKANDPSYTKAMGIAGKALLKQMKIDGYDIGKERTQELETKTTDMYKTKADISVAIARGRKLNQPAIERDLLFNCKKQMEAVNPKLEVTEEIHQKVIEATTKMIQHFNKDKHINQKYVEKFIDKLPITSLNKIANQKDFKEQILNGYNTYKVQNNLVDKLITQEQEELQMDNSLHI